MKVLVSGYHNPKFLTITEYIERAVSKSGHKLCLFDDRGHLFPKRLRRKSSFLNRISIKWINYLLMRMVSKHQPDLVLVTGGHRILEGTIRKLKGFSKSVLWTTDAPIDFRNIETAAKAYDHVFCQGTEAVELLFRKGLKAHWLPMACEPQIHRQMKISPEERSVFGNDVVFVGSYYPTRFTLFKKLSGFDFGIWGPGWNKAKGAINFQSHLKGDHSTPSEWVKIYNASKIILAPHFQECDNGLPVFQASPRIFEAMACGAFVISDYQRDVFALFDDGKHLVGFKTVDELIKKIEYYLLNSKKRREIAERGKKEVLDKHRYVDRVQKLLSIVSGN
jgi:spore maturation protein CgeB